jgi:hypothetical protein
LTSRASPDCSHLSVHVDYDHPHGLVPGVLVAELQATARGRARAVMTLKSPRCSICGVTLERSVLAKRIVVGGDLYDARFIWA